MEPRSHLSTACSEESEVICEEFKCRSRLRNRVTASLKRVLERQNVANGSQHLLHKLPTLEEREVVSFFTSADEAGWEIELVLNGHDAAALA